MGSGEKGNGDTSIVLMMDQDQHQAKQWIKNKGLN